MKKKKNSSIALWLGRGSLFFGTNTLAYFTAMSLKKKKNGFIALWLGRGSLFFGTNTLAYFTAMSMKKKKSSVIVSTPDRGSLASGCFFAVSAVQRPFLAAASSVRRRRKRFGEFRRDLTTDGSNNIDLLS